MRSNGNNFNSRENELAKLANLVQFKRNSCPEDWGTGPLASDLCTRATGVHIVKTRTVAGAKYQD